MSCIESVRYNIGLKCKYAKILLNTKPMQNDAQKRNFKQKKNIDTEYFYDIVWRDFARWVIFTGQLRNPWQTLAEPLSSAVPQGWKSLVQPFDIEWPKCKCNPRMSTKRHGSNQWYEIVWDTRWYAETLWAETEMR